MLKANLKIKYPVNIIVGPGSIGELSEILTVINPYKIAVIMDEIVERLWFRELEKAIESTGVEYQKIVLPVGEECKKLKVAIEIWGTLLDNGFTRDSLLIGLGGGAVLDVTGFTASTYMRGCHLVYIPTTLLSQVDAAIGGKNSINFEGKNIIGTFYHPEYVVVDPQILQTLPFETFRSGLSEVVKHAIIQGEESFKFIEDNVEEILSRNINVLTEIIKQSILTKLNIIISDYTEKGRRILLNFGHTIAHSLEKALDFKISHGHAVSIGLVVESKLAELITDFPSEDVERIRDLLMKLDLPVEPLLPIETLVKYMKYDKKFLRGRPRLPLPKRIGEFEIISMKWERLLKCISELKI